MRLRMRLPPNLYSEDPIVRYAHDWVGELAQLCKLQLYIVAASRCVQSKPLGAVVHVLGLCVR